MPFINIKIFEGHSVERKREMVKQITQCVSKIAQVPENGIQVVIEDIPRHNWAVGGKLLDNLSNEENE